MTSENGHSNQTPLENEENIDKIGAFLKGVQEQLALIVLLVGAVATLLSPFLPDKNASQIATVIALLIALSGGAILIYKKYHKTKYQVIKSTKRPNRKVAFRDLQPFEEGDNLFGRDRELARLNTMVVAYDFRFGVLWGESGSGKTSLLRAGLIPELRTQGFLPVYIAKPTREPQEAVLIALRKIAAEASNVADQELHQLIRATAPRGKKIIVIFDQFEEFFLLHRTKRLHAGLGKWLGEILRADLPIIFLISIRSDFFGYVQEVLDIADSSSRLRHSLVENFNADQARQIFVEAAQADAVSFERPLVDAVISDLQVENSIRPVELQIIGTRLVQQDIATLNRYELAGRAKGILSSYINDAILQSREQDLARLVLRQMCTESFDAKSPVDQSMEEVVERILGVSQSIKGQSERREKIEKVVNELLEARILIHTDDDKYNLVHDYLAPSIGIATKGVETNAERANRLLRRYVAQYGEEPTMRIPARHLRLIETHATTKVKEMERARELIKISKQAFYTRISILIALPALTLLFTGVIFIFLSNSYYLSLEDMVAGESVMRPGIVVRAGHPQWKNVPGFDQVVIETDFTLDDLDPSLEDQIMQEQSTGYWSEEVEGEPTWNHQLVEMLAPIHRGLALHWLGQTEYGAEVLGSSREPLNEEMASTLAEMSLIFPDDSKLVPANAVEPLTKRLQDADQYGHSELLDTVSTLLILKRINPEGDPSSRNVTEVLLSIIKDSNAGPNRDTALFLLTLLVQAEPDSVSVDDVRYLNSFVSDVQTPLPLTTRLNAVTILGQLGEVNPKNIVLTPDEFESLIGLIEKREINVSSFEILVLPPGSFAFGLGQIARANPKLVTPEITQHLSLLAMDPGLPVSLRMDAAMTLAALAPAQTQAPTVTQELIESFLDIYVDPQVDDTTRQAALSTLKHLTQANPDAVTPMAVRRLMASMVVHTSGQYIPSSDAITCLVTLAEAAPQAFTNEVTQPIFTILDDPQSSSYEKVEVANLLVVLAQTNPEFAAQERIQSLITIVADQQVYLGTRLELVADLGQISEANPDLLNSAMMEDKLEGLKSSVMIENDLGGVQSQTYAEAAEQYPELVSPEVLQLLVTSMTTIPDDIVTYSIEDTGNSMAQLVRANPDAVSSEVIQSIQQLLQENNQKMRSAGIYASFYIALGAPSKADVLRNELLQLRNNSPLPHARIAASKALELIAISDWIQEARIQPQRAPSVMLNLFLLGTNLRFGSHLRPAVAVGIEEIRTIVPAWSFESSAKP